MAAETIRASAPLRISFVGGGTDFPHYYERHGGAVLSATIDHAAHVSLAPRDDRQVRIRSLDLGHLVEYGLERGPAFDGFNLLEFDQGGATVHPLALAPEAVAELRSHLLLCYTGHVRTDLGLIATQIRMYEEGREDTIVGMKQLQAMAFEMRRELEDGNLD